MARKRKRAGDGWRRGWRFDDTPADNCEVIRHVLARHDYWVVAADAGSLVLLMIDRFIYLMGHPPDLIFRIRLRLVGSEGPAGEVWVALVPKPMLPAEVLNFYMLADGLDAGEGASDGRDIVVISERPELVFGHLEAIRLRGAGALARPELN